MTRYRRSLGPVALGLLAAGAIAGCSSSGDAECAGCSSLAVAHTRTGTTSPSSPAVATGTVVTLKNIAFHPAVVHIKAGQSVTWDWEDADIDTQHNVTSTGPTHFQSSTTKETGTYTVTFPHAGTYDFECTIHPQSMQGKVIVG